MKKPHPDNASASPVPFSPSAPSGQNKRVSRAEGLARLNSLAALSGKGIGTTPKAKTMLIAAPESRHEPFPLSDMQQAYWLGRDASLEGGGVAMQSYLELRCESLDVERLQAALDALVARHEMLRAVVLEEGAQRILPLPLRIPVTIEDLGALDESGQAARLAEISRSMTAEVSDLRVWPQSEARFSRLGGGEKNASGVLHLRFDQWAMDGRSFQIVTRELARLYEDPEVPLPPLDVSFRDYLTAVEREKETPEYANSLEYWRKKLDTLAGPPSLPRRESTRGASLDFSPVDQDEHCAVIRRSDVLDEADTAALLKESAKRGVTHVSALGAIYAGVLAFWSGNSRFTLNSPRFNRNLSWHPGLNDVVGEFATFTLHEYDASLGTTVMEQAEAFQEEAWGTLTHGRVSGMTLLRELARRRGGMSAAAMPVVFTAMPDASDGGSFEDDLRPLGILQRLYGSTPQVWLDCVFSVFSNKLHMYWDCRDEVFAPGLVEPMFQEFMRLVRLLARDPEAWDRPLPVRAPKVQLARRADLYVKEPIPESTLLDDFLRQAAARPDAPALFDEEGSRSYAQLRRDVGLLAAAVGARLRGDAGTVEMPAAAGPRVAVLMDRGWRSVAAELAVMASGGIFVPLDPASPPARRRAMLRAAAPVLALVDAAHADDAAAAGVCALDAKEALEEQSRELDPGEWNAGPAAYAMMTSGTTGEPKIVTVGHRGLLNAVLHSNSRFGIGPEDRFLGVTSLHHDLSLYDVFGPLTSGAALVLLPQERAADPGVWTEHILRHRVTVWNSVPAYHSLLMDHCRASGTRLPLRLHLLGGDWVRPSVFEAMAVVCPEAVLCTTGGPTETTLWNILYEARELPDGWRSIPYGRPIPNNAYHILDESLRDSPDWVTGEMYCSGVGVCLHTTAADADPGVFARHPDDGRRLYRTGDLGRFRPDGLIEILGRADNQINIGGYRFDPAEVEKALLAVPGVDRAVLVPVGTGKEHDNVQTLGAFVCAPGAELTEDALSRELLSRFPLPMVPRLWAFGEAEPLTPNGKVDRKAIARLLAGAGGNRDGGQDEEAARQPETPLESFVVSLWQEALGKEDIHPGTNFFRAGGDSLKAMLILGRLKARLPVDLSLTAIFTAPTVRGLAGAVLAEVARRARAI